MLLSDSFEQTINFEIPDDKHQLGVRCSGGADSSILLYMIVKYLKDNNRNDTKINVISCSNDEKHRWNGRKVADVINYTIDNLKFDNFDIHYNFYRDTQQMSYVRDFEKQLFEENRIDCVISGITAIPPDDVTVENINNQNINLVNTLEVSDRSANRNNPTWQTAWEYFDKGYYLPFVNVDKRFIADMYKQYNVDDLLQLTRSCEDVPVHTYYKPDFEYKPCGKCWWCLERKWAFGEF